MCNDAWIFVLRTSLPSAAQLLLAVWTDFYNIFAWILQSINFHFKKISLWKLQADLYSCITLKRMQMYTSLNDSIKFSILADCPPFFPLTKGLYNYTSVVWDFEWFSIISSSRISSDFPSFRRLGFGVFFPPFPHSTVLSFRLLGSPIVMGNAPFASFSLFRIQEGESIGSYNSGGCFLWNFAIVISAMHDWVNCLFRFFVLVIRFD